MTEKQQKPKITEEQRSALLIWLAAEYSEALICKWFEERGWAPLAKSTISYHRTKYAAVIDGARADRRAKALNSGLALKEERVKRLVEHADELEAIKWVPDDKGRMWNEKAGRETLDDIAKEMGHRRTGVDIASQELGTFLDRLRDNLPAEQYAAILKLASELGKSAA